ncbi:MAG: hypothetical protein JWN79_1565 [Gemmatimonadetes bacterium]|nr:hypothetical protein [Gemmatimonadota bacterium]
MSAPVLPVETGIPPRRAHLARYGLWQLRDYAINRGAPTLLVAALFGALPLFSLLRGLQASIERTPPRYLQLMIARHGSIELYRQSMLHELSGGFLRSFLGTVVFLGALLAMNGLVSNDRKLGHYRFLFSKPVSPLRYYGQAFLLHWAGFLLVVIALAALYGAYVEPVLTPTFVAVLASVFLMYGGVAFLMTTLVRWDWLALAASVIASQVLWDRFGASTSVLAKLLYLLPPIHRTGDLYTALVGGTALPGHTLEWIAAYGAVCLVAGLVVLRTRRLAIS